MKNIYIGSGQRNKSNGGFKWKLYGFLIVFMVMVGAILKVGGPTIVEKWINRKGAGDNGYAFSIRDVELSLEKGQIVLNDVKIFNPKTDNELLESPSVTIQLNVQEFLLSQDKLVSVIADQVDLTLSKDLSSEIERIKEATKKTDLNLDSLDGKIAKLNIIEQKENNSRTMIELKDVNLKVKEVGINSINKKTEFTITSNIAEGGKLNLSGKTMDSNGRTPWSIQGSLKKVPATIFNKIAGNKLPFSFNEESLNAEIKAQSENGKVSGEIAPDIRKLNILVEKPGIPTQSIARILNDELTFTLPFTLKDELTLNYSETYKELRSYRRYPAAADNPAPNQTPITKTEPKAKKTLSFWPF